ncbi:hypothetical protein Pint_25169 [Pistacia integerrima]|uniref:Uncharacterized protein n=1 Tax=Pistacia integerrima TaxID=434235 RepID=A0ACC0YA69_9ROSI|nr:hypothetical protein Pint_25169 [Pistacia integerrima]
MELREAAIASYNNEPEDLKQRAYDFFKEMDMDGDGKISSFEFMEFLQQAGYSVIQPNFFNELDHDGDGSLDFWEVLTFFYVCAGGDTYELCLSCCRTVFLDNYIMLLSRRRPPMAPPSNMYLFSSAQPQPQLQLQLHQTQTRSWSVS